MKQLLGGCLQAAGLMIAALTGLCTLTMLAGAHSWRRFLTALGSAVIPLLIGVVRILAGRVLIRSARDDHYY